MDIPLAHVVAAEQVQAGPVVGGVQYRLGSVAEFRARTRDVPSRRAQDGQDRLPAEGPQRDDHAQGRAQVDEFVGEPVAAAVAFGRGGFVRRWCAAHRGGDSGAVQGQSVVDRMRFRLGGEPDVVERSVKNVPGTITGEHPAGAVGAMRGRSQTHHRDRRVRRSETGNRPAPIGFVAKRRAFGPRYLLTPVDQPRATRTPGHELVEFGQVPGSGSHRRGIVDRVVDQFGGHFPHCANLADQPLDRCLGTRKVRGMGASDDKSRDEKTNAEDGTGGEETAATTTEPADDLVSTHHTITAKGAELSYTATTGRVVLREEVYTDGKFEGHKPKAEVFMTAYVADTATPGNRPVTFAFNGGPGSSSVWLHLGLLGPRRVLSGDAGQLTPPPYGMADNHETLLAHSDLVFIDPVSTGFSRAVKGGHPGDFHGYQGDLESIGELIRLWTSRNGRWMSPKYLAGESYGTIRAAALAEHLQSRYGLYFNGLLLISSVLDMGTVRFTDGNDLPYTLFLPTYAAIAHHHGKHGDRPLREVLDEAEEFAARDYPWALARGARLTESERADIVRRTADLIGLSEDYVDRADLRVEHLRFFTELLRDQRRTVGRMDGRFTGFEPDAAGERFTDDPSVSGIRGAYSAAINHYLREELGYVNDLPYEVLSSRVQPWSYKDFEGAHVSVVDKLGDAMRENPHLRVHVGCGHTDGATPYFAAEHVLARLPIPSQLRANIDVRYYPAGHMMYVHEPSRIKQSADLADFVTA